ncbi:hypothetical protein K438DRAFT_1792393 [Mycena galopus ATCC 62051]|nr:hypothetical protein K438DRAFT_1792393 [Mycena galopus ATCC 62051]
MHPLPLGQTHEPHLLSARRARSRESRAPSYWRYFKRRAERCVGVAAAERGKAVESREMQCEAAAILFKGGAASPADGPRIPGKECGVSTLKRCRRGSLDGVASRSMDAEEQVFGAPPNGFKIRKSRDDVRCMAAAGVRLLAWKGGAARLSSTLILQERLRPTSSPKRPHHLRVARPVPARPIHAGSNKDQARAPLVRQLSTLKHQVRGERIALLAPHISPFDLLSSSPLHLAPLYPAHPHHAATFDSDAATTDKEIVSPAPRRAVPPLSHVRRATHAVQRDDVHFHLRQGGGVGTREGGARSPRREAGGGRRDEARGPRRRRLDGRDRAGGLRGPTHGVPPGMPAYCSRAYRGPSIDGARAGQSSLRENPKRSTCAPSRKRETTSDSAASKYSGGRGSTAAPTPSERCECACDERTRAVPSVRCRREGFHLDRVDGAWGGRRGVNAARV